MLDFLWPIYLAPFLYFENIKMTGLLNYIDYSKFYMQQIHYKNKEEIQLNQSCSKKIKINIIFPLNSYIYNVKTNFRIIINHKGFNDIFYIGNNLCWWSSELSIINHFYKWIIRIIIMKKFTKLRNKKIKVKKLIFDLNCKNNIFCNYFRQYFCE